MNFKSAYLVIVSKYALGIRSCSIGQSIAIDSDSDLSDAGL
jgi:hypothetical protein